MKITAANIYLVNIGFMHPILLELETDAGIVGVGEAAVAYGQGATAAAGMIKDLVNRFVIGRDPRRIEELYTEICEHSFWAKRGGPIIYSGISAIEIAMWDIKGKMLGVPVYELLGGAMRSDVRVYANGWWSGCMSPLDFGRAAERTVADGYDALKLYPLATMIPATQLSTRTGTSIRHVERRMVDRAFANEAFERVKAVRDAVGPDVDIMLDLSGGLTPDEMIRLCRRWEELDIFFVEEPADPFDIGALAKVASGTTIPIAAGERLYTRNDFRDYLERRVIDIIQPDVGNSGGIMETKKIAAMAEAYSVRVQPHICGSPVATAAALQVDCCIPNFVIQELYPYRPADLFDLVDDAPDAKVSGGRMPVPERAGIGVNLVREKVEPHLWARCE